MYRNWEREATQEETSYKLVLSYITTLGNSTFAMATQYNHVIRALSEEEKRQKYDALLEQARQKDPMFGAQKFMLDHPWEEYRKELRMIIQRRPMSPTTQDICRRNADDFARGILERDAKNRTTKPQ